MMKKKILTILSSLVIVAFSNAQGLSFKDKNFEKAVIENFDTNKDRKIDQSEADNVQNLFLTGKNIESVEDLVHFKNAKMVLMDSNMILFIELKNLKALELFSCTNCKTVAFKAENLPSLTSLYLDNNKIVNASFKDIPKIKQLTIPFNQLKAIDTNLLTTLQDLNIEHNQVQKLDISKNNKLQSLNVKGNPLKETDIKKGTKTDITIFGFQQQ